MTAALRPQSRRDEKLDIDTNGLTLTLWVGQAHVVNQVVNELLGEYYA